MQQEQAHRQFDETAAKFIMRKVNELSGGYEFLEFQDADGVTPGIYVSETYINLFPTGLRGIEAGNLFEWNPACDTEDDTDPRSSPLLPIPFTANELAAFLLYGVGDYIQEKLGPIGRLDEDELDGLGGVRDKLPRQALRAAYAEAERAQQVVGPPDIEAQKLADTLSDQLDEAEHEANRRFGVFARDISADEANRRRDMAIESVAELRRRTETAREKAAKGLHEWRKAMVRYLLPPVSPAPEQPVRADSEHEGLARLSAEAEARRIEQAQQQGESALTERHVGRQRQHEERILSTLQGMGYDPTKLPRPPAGTPGPKAEARAKLSDMSSKVFSKAWERLSEFGDIGYAK